MNLKKDKTLLETIDFKKEKLTRVKAVVMLLCVDSWHNCDLGYSFCIDFSDFDHVRRTFEVLVSLQLL